ncbi:helix-turn-helix domain-containing protein [Streptomyces mangrovi]|uniref:helix-turn-helix domain-containing protein n=1 Tax=Streptomyces mangrovi TaxID=1206892 RepID=UPI00399C97E7
MATIASRVRELRGRRGWTAAELGAQMKKRGVRWDRFTVTSLENGKRQNVTVVELLALALVLDVAPVNLLVPLDNVPYQVTPTRTEDAAGARAWVRGERPLAGVDLRTFHAERPLSDIEKEQRELSEWTQANPIRFRRGGALYDAQGNPVEEEGNDG